VEFDDIQRNLIVDLGAGTGRLSLSSAFLNPLRILSIDVDPRALAILKENINLFQFENLIFPLCMNVKNFGITPHFINSLSKITTIMNPPFGVQKRGADRIFLETAFMFSDVIYSIHLANKMVHKFITDYAYKHKWHVDYVLPYTMVLEKTFPFHEQKRKEIEVNLYRFKKS
jgi:putative methylase